MIIIRVVDGPGTIKEDVNCDLFPRRSNPTPRSVVWDLGEVEAWLRPRCADPDAGRIRKAPPPDAHPRKTRHEEALSPHRCQSYRAARRDSYPMVMATESAGQISLEQRAAALALFNKLVAESFTVLSVMGGHFRAAAKFADQYALGLHAGDPRHLATASEHGATVRTLDLRLAEAGPVLGVPTQLLA